MYRILVVDEELNIRQFYQEVFESIGYLVVTSDGQKPILSLLDQEKPDLLILDINPAKGNSARKLLRELRSLRIGLPVILSTSLEEGFNNDLKSLLNDDYYVINTQDIEPLLNRVQEILPTGMKI